MGMDRIRGTNEWIVFLAFGIKMGGCHMYAVIVIMIVRHYVITNRQTTLNLQPATAEKLERMDSHKGKNGIFIEIMVNGYKQRQV
jgi:hypothetical protein